MEIENEEIKVEEIQAIRNSSQQLMRDENDVILEGKIKYFQYYWRLCIALTFVETLTICRFIILPVMLIRMIDYPTFIFFPWPLWTLLNFSMNIMISFASTKYEPNVLSCTQFCFNSNWIYQSYYESKLIFDRKVVSIVHIAWSIVDIGLSVIVITIGIVMVLFVFTDSDGTLIDGWEVNYGFIIVQIILSLVAVILRILLIIFHSLCLRYYIDDAVISNIPFHQFRQSLIDTYYTLTTHLYVHKQRVYIFLFSCICWFISFIFLCRVLHLYLHTRYYFNDTKMASYSHCEPMVPQTCMLPFPSSHFLVSSDGTTDSNYKMNIQSNSLPFIKAGRHLSPNVINSYDGFSVLSPILWYLPGDNIEKQLVDNDNLPLSLYTNATTLLLRTKGGGMGEVSGGFTLHPHFSEQDHIDFHEKTRVSYMMPAVSLEYNTTYIAIVQKLKLNVNDVDDESLIEPSPLMLQYIGCYFKDQVICTKDIYRKLLEDSRYVLYETNYFPVLESMGIDIARIQLMWHFHTVSKNSLLSTLNTLKNKTIEIIQNKVNNVVEGSSDEELFREVRITKGNCPAGKHGNVGDQNVTYSEMKSVAYYKVKVPWYLKYAHKVWCFYAVFKWAQVHFQLFSFPFCCLLFVLFS